MSVLQQERQERAQDALRKLGLHAPAYALPTAGEVDLRDLRRSLHGLYDVRPDHRPEIEEAIDALVLYWASRR